MRIIIDNIFIETNKMSNYHEKDTNFRSLAFYYRF
ncbi:hypothetical protein ACOMICROBIO_FLGHMIGD_02428 [Vibrio sp. B1FLJ16]|nr:hypothetical protein ACOMICROBIO_FLGHMIGD_02428 [Vibrio sp. B1FLJ16]CAE6915958.1 hypothetical protein ACOMICROBIO_FLGHMIGD_02428 [Vibrio sp. B1FLJ16]